MRITNYLEIPQGHAGIDFVDITTNDDTELFIDPCLIERGADSMSRQAAAIVSDYIDQLYADMRSGHWQVTHVFDRAHEVNETRLGYGNGRNGKGKTPEGMRDCLDGLCKLANEVPIISKVQDISIFVEDYAEDGLSDLLTNILRHLLSDFTATQMTSYGIKPSGVRPVAAWDIKTHSWQQYEKPYWIVGDRIVLLVPKWWVRKRFLFKAHQYLCMVIIDRLRNDSTDPTFKNLTKKDVYSQLERDSEHWEYEKVAGYTLEYPDALDEYHRRIPERYAVCGCMDDNELDEAVYCVQRHRRRM